MLAVISHDNAPRLGETADGELLLFQSDAVHYRGQIVAAVVAETLEQAREAAAAVRVDYAPRDHDVELPPPTRGSTSPTRSTRRSRPTPRRATAEAAFARAEVSVDQTYATAPIHNNPMEPHATPRHLGGRRPHALRLDPGRLRRARARSPQVFELDPEQVRVIAQHVGGGFGSKGTPRPHVGARRDGGQRASAGRSSSR